MRTAAWAGRSRSRLFVLGLSGELEPRLTMAVLDLLSTAELVRLTGGLSVVLIVFLSAPCFNDVGIPYVGIP